MSVDELVEQLVTARKELLQQIAGLADESVRTRPGEGDWSIIEVLAHLIDVDRHYLAQALAIRDNPGHLFVHFDDESWKTEHPDVEDWPLAEVLGALESSFQEVMESLASLDDEDLQRVGRHPRGIPYKVRDVFLRWPTHDRNHTQQIRAVRAALGRVS